MTAPNRNSQPRHWLPCGPQISAFRRWIGSYCFLSDKQETREKSVSCERSSEAGKKWHLTVELSKNSWYKRRFFSRSEPARTSDSSCLVLLCSFDASYSRESNNFIENGEKMIFFCSWWNTSWKGIFYHYLSSIRFMFSYIPWPASSQDHC